MLLHVPSVCLFDVLYSYNVCYAIGETSNRITHLRSYKVLTFSYVTSLGKRAEQVQDIRTIVTFAYQ